MVKAVCDSCGYSRDFDSTNAGRKFKCPKCATLVVIPAPPENAMLEFKESAQKVDMFLMTHAKYFEGHQISAVREKLLGLDESRSMLIHTISFKDPTTTLIVSILAGAYGIDRFMLGDIGLGVGKLLTCGGLGIWAIVDWFNIQSRAREINFQKVMSIY